MNKKPEQVSEQILNTYCYTFEIKTTMLVFADNSEHASVMVDSANGYVTKREVNLIDTQLVYGEK